jgi:hypothetical protein
VFLFYKSAINTRSLLLLFLHSPALMSKNPLFPFRNPKWIREVGKYGHELVDDGLLNNFDSEIDTDSEFTTTSIGAGSASRCNTIFACQRFLFDKGNNKNYYNINYWNGAGEFPTQPAGKTSGKQFVVRWTARVKDDSHAPEEIKSAGKLSPKMFWVPDHDDYNFKELQRSSTVSVNVHGIHAPFPIYKYELWTTSAGRGSQRAINVQRTPLACSVETICWLLAFTLRMKYKSVLDYLGLTEKDREQLTQKLTYNNEQDDARRREIYDYLCNVVIWRRSQASIAATSTELINNDGRPIDHDSLINKAVRESAVYIIAQRHAECIRFFGGHRFAVLANYFAEAYLMGLTLETLDAMYDTLITDPTRLAIESASLPPTRMSEYWGEPPSSFDRAMTFFGMVHCLSNTKTPVKLSHVVQAFVNHAVKTGHYVGGHMHIPLPDIMKRAVSEARLLNDCGISMPTVADDNGDYETDDVLPNVILNLSLLNVMNIMEPIAALIDSKTIKVHNPHAANWQECIEWGPYDSRLLETKLFLNHAYMDLSLVYYCIDRVYQNFKNHLLMNGVVEFPPPPDGSTMCSEQRAALDMLHCTPVLNLTGPGGAGKTEAVKHIIQAMGKDHLGNDKCLVVTSMWSHADTVRRRIPGCICGGMHRIVADHFSSCDRCVPSVSSVPTPENSHRNIPTRAALQRGVATGAKHGSDDDYISIFVKNYDHCPYENIEMVIIEECSTCSPRVVGATLWLLLRCAKKLRYIVTSGDLNQLPAIQPGRLQFDLAEGLGYFKFEHRHRQESEVLCDFAEAIARGDHNKARRLIDGKTIIQESCDLSNIEEKTYLMIKNHDLTAKNSQFIMRTNSLREKLIPIIQRECTQMQYRANYSKDNPIYARTNRLVWKKTVGPFHNNQQWEVLAVVWVDPILVYLHPDPRAGSRINLRSNGAPTSSMQPQTNVKRDFSVEQQSQQLRQSVDACNGAAAVRLAGDDGEKLSRLMTSGSRPLIGIQNTAMKHTIGAPTEPGNRLPVHQEITKMALKELEVMFANMNYARGGVEVAAIRYQMVGSKVTVTSEMDRTTMNHLPVLMCRSFSSSSDPAEAEPPIPATRQAVYLEVMKHEESDVFFVPLCGDVTEYIRNGDAQTGHTFQGRGVHRVVFVEPNQKSPFATRQMLYTAVTRGINQVILLMGVETLVHMINNEEPRRNSALGEALKELKQFHMETPLVPYLMEAASLELAECNKFGVRDQPIVDMHIANMRTVERPDYDEDAFMEDLIAYQEAKEAKKVKRPAPPPVAAKTSLDLLLSKSSLVMDEVERKDELHSKREQKKHKRHRSRDEHKDNKRRKPVGKGKKEVAKTSSQCGESDSEESDDVYSAFLA